MTGNVRRVTREALVAHGAMVQRLVVRDPTYPAFVTLVGEPGVHEVPLRLPGQLVARLHTEGGRATVEETAREVEGRMRNQGRETKMYLARVPRTEILVSREILRHIPPVL